MLQTMARKETGSCAVELLEGEIPDHDGSSWVYDKLIVSMLLSREGFEAEGRDRALPDGDWQPIGTVLVTAPHREVIGRGPGGHIRALRCVFDPPRGEMAECLSALTPEELTRALRVEDATVHVLLRRILRELQNPGFAGDTLIESMALTLLIESIRAIRQGDRSEKRGLSPQHLKMIEDYLAGIEVGFPSVSDVARLCGFSTHYFGRLFLRSTGQTVGQYLANWRMRRAEMLLAETDLPLKEIAYRLGYANPANFSTAFRVATRMTPRSYRATRREAVAGTA
ncbi:helix-turn-helix domain-containing protein [Flavisphingomonas formosensis]|uniref:helix-turn-helix domain-containing protein n=1 Tax=Flavisphingomonas formosensis TaxID=861534 RepID=UPI0012FB7E77|nr:helix-turn-helix transcriptional regulator [Sphingomonas formosensis]